MYQSLKKEVTKQKPIQKKNGKKTNNTGIPDTLKAKYENHSGFSFDDVKVHYNSDKPAQFQALAYTQGNQVFVAPRQKMYLEHELGHVVQQKQGIVKPTGKINNVPVNEDKSLERKADYLSQSVESSSGEDGNQQKTVQCKGIVQFTRGEIPYISEIEDGNVTLTLLIQWFEHCKQQIEEAKSEHIDVKLITHFITQYQIHYNALLELRVIPAGIYSYTQIQGQSNSIEQHFWLAIIAVNSIRGVLNKSYASVKQKAKEEEEQPQKAKKEKVVLTEDTDNHEYLWSPPSSAEGKLYKFLLQNDYIVKGNTITIGHRGGGGKDKRLVVKIYPSNKVYLIGICNHKGTDNKHYDISDSLVPGMNGRKHIDLFPTM